MVCSVKELLGNAVSIESKAVSNSCRLLLVNA